MLRSACCLSLYVAGTLVLANVGTAASPTERVEILTRAPLHEAVAAPINTDPIPGRVVVAQPAPPPSETPPDERIAGGEWIPGYWFWDDDGRGFVWISGVWRIPPPGRRFVPGYWAEVSGGRQWISGFWAAADTSEIRYFPRPPDSAERGPNGPAPGPDYFWTPGSWKFVDDQYEWRPGNWQKHRANAAWSPEHYLWTPAGYVLVEGYWDLPLPQRGVVFAPRRYRPGTTANSKPSAVVIDLNSALHHLFVWPSQRHYCFGDYYQTSYSRYGVQPQFDFHDRRGFDPLYTYYSGRFRALDVDFPEKAGERHKYFLRKLEERPPRLWTEETAGDLAVTWRQLAATGVFGKTNWEPEATRSAVGQSERERRELENRRRTTESATPSQTDPRLRLPEPITTAWRDTSPAR